MSDVTGAAEAAPAPETAPSIPEKPSGSAREAVSRAFASVEEAQPPRPVQSQTKPVEAPEPKAAEKKAEPVKADAKPAEKPKATEKTEPKVEAPKRAADGKFAPKEAAEGEGAEAVSSPAAAPKPTAFPEPPKRFSEDARSAWEDAPEPVRAEAHRAIRELETGFQKHRADAEAYGEVREFAEMAKQSGTTLKEAMARYVNMENGLRQNPIAGLSAIAQNLGIPLREIAAQIMGQKPDQVAGQQDRVITQLRNQVDLLSRQIGGVTKTIETQRTEATHSQVADFAKQPGHERFEELAPDIAFFLKNNRAQDLGEAYQLAERLNPGPAKPAPLPVNPPPPKADPAPQTRKGTLAVHGAPSSGSDPATRKPPSSARESVKRALAQVGGV